MAYSGFKGIGPNGLGTSKAEPKTVNADGPSTFSRPQFKTAQDQKNINSMQAISPAKKNGMKYDIKEASNQNLSAKARKNYAENAQHDSKKGYR
jgi:hypothetical protein|tara:strand:+ start:109 stop:390 length:282 start_codon:yes stop_codon:yes gene_type:complete